MAERTLKESMQELAKSEEVLRDAQELMRAEEEAEPGYASGVPDFALARLECS